MTVQVKICGLRTTETLDAALGAGADFFGLVFYEPSPRSLPREQAALLVRHAAGRAKSVAAAGRSGPTPTCGLVIDEVNPDYVQAARLGVARAGPGDPGARRTSRDQGDQGRLGCSDAAAAHAFDEAADLILFDAKAPDGGDAWLPGGNGIAFDWQDPLAGV